MARKTNEHYYLSVWAPDKQVINLCKLVANISIVNAYILGHDYLDASFITLYLVFQLPNAL